MHRREGRNWAFRTIVGDRFAVVESFEKQSFGHIVGVYFSCFCEEEKNSRMSK
jgi:hypothetical protein